MKLLQRVGLLVLSFAVQTQFAQSQPSANIEQCNPVLVQNIEYDTLDKSAKLAWLKMVNQSNFEDMKRKAGGKFVFGDLDLGFTWDEFNQKRQQLFTQESYSESEEVAVSRLRFTTPSEARERWLECVKALANDRSRFGLFLWVDDENRYGATVHVAWRSTPPPKAGKIDSQNLLGGEVAGLPANQWLPNAIIPSGGSTSAIIRRNGDQEIRGTVTINGLSAAFRSPAVERPAYVATINIAGSGVRSTPFTANLAGIIKHSRCIDHEYWYEMGQYCFAFHQQPTRLRSFSTQPINGQLAGNGCFQATTQMTSPGSANNCIKVSLSYKECSAALSPFCFRGIGAGTPIDMLVEGVSNEDVAIPSYNDTSIFDGAKRWQYPVRQVPADVRNVKYRFVAVVREMSSGKTIVLDDQNRTGGGFRAEVPQAGTIILIRDVSTPVQVFNYTSPIE